MTLSTTFPSYLIGTATVGVGLMCFASPGRAYKLFGLPLNSPTTQPSKFAEISPDKTHPAAASTAISGPPTPSPYLYAMAVRQLSFGLALVAFEATGNTDAVATMAAAMCLMGAVDGWIVWKYGGELQNKAWNHWNGTIISGAWYLLRFGSFRDLPFGFSV
jgi:hypothetical protein